MLLQVEDDPVQAPDHKYVYAPVPPETLDTNVAEPPICIELGLAEHEAVRTGV